MRPKNSLIRGSLIAACAMAAACVGDLDGAADRDHSVRTMEPSPPVGFAPRDPGASIFSSAATPLGWATAAERRYEEWRFAHAEEPSQAPPDAIGGGPEDFDDED